MSDRSSAFLFRIIFRLLAKNPTEDNKKLATEIYELTTGYDFHWSDMDVDEILIDFGLASIEVDEDGEENIIYKNE